MVKRMHGTIVGLFSADDNDNDQHNGEQHNNATNNGNWNYKRWQSSNFTEIINTFALHQHTNRLVLGKRVVIFVIKLTTFRTCIIDTSTSN